MSSAAAAGKLEEVAAVRSGRLELDADGGSESEAAVVECLGRAELDGCESEASFCFFALLSAAGAVVGEVLLLVETFADKCCEVAAENIGLHSSNAALRSSSSFQSATCTQDKIRVGLLGAGGAQDDKLVWLVAERWCCL